jgi:O-antigen/teichoic acid export membrane protein
MIDKIKNIFSEYKSLLASVSLVMLLRVFGAVIGFFSGIVITRYLGITEAGYYFYVVDFIVALATLGSLGLHHLLLRDVARQASDVITVSRIFKYIISIVILVAIINIIAIFILNHVIAEQIGKPEIANLLLILSPLLLLIPLQNYIATFLQSVQSIFQSALIQFAIFYTLLLLLVFLVQPSDAEQAVYLHLGALIMAVALGLIFVKKHLVKSSSVPRPDLKGWQSFFTMHIITHLSVTIISLVNGFYLSADEFAVLTAAIRFTLLISFCLIAFNFVAAPKYAKLYQQGNLKELASFSQAITRLLIAIIIPVSFIIFIFSDQFMSLYGQAFKPYGYILTILVAGQIVNVASGSVAYLLNLSGNEKTMRNITLISTPITALLSWLLTQWLGLVGVAIGMALTAIILNASAYIMVVKRLGFHTIKLAR